MDELKEPHLTRNGIARQAERWAPSNDSKREGFSGLDAYFPELHLGTFVQHGLANHVEVTDADTTCGYNDVAVDGSPKSRSGALDGVGCNSTIDGNATGPMDPSCQRVGIG